MRRPPENDAREHQNDVQKRQNDAKMRRRRENAKVGLVGACFVLYNCPMLDKQEGGVRHIMGVGAKMRDDFMKMTPVAFLDVIVMRKLIEPGVYICAYIVYKNDYIWFTNRSISTPFLDSMMM